MRAMLIALTAVCLMVATGVATAQDWPQWRGPTRDGRVAALAMPAAIPDSLTRAWSIEVGAGDATPALVAGRLYVFTREGDSEVLRCLNAADGAEVWRTAAPVAPVTGPSGSHAGPRCSPAVADGKVVTVGVYGRIACVNAENGAVLWSADPFANEAPRFQTSASPLILNGMAIAHLGSETNGAVIAYDLATGAEKWRWAGEGPQYASPVVLALADDTRVIVTLGAQSFLGLNAADGKLLWQIPFVPQGMAYNAATPVVVGRTVYITGAMRGTKAFSVKQEDGACTLTELWSNADVAGQFCSPIVKDGRVFGMTNRGNLFCLDAADGKTLWLDETSRDRQGFCSMLDLGAAIVATPPSGEAIVFQPSGSGLVEMTRLKLADTPVFATPVVSGSSVFVKDQSSLSAMRVP